MDALKYRYSSMWSSISNHWLHAALPCLTFRQACFSQTSCGFPLQLPHTGTGSLDCLTGHVQAPRVISNQSSIPASITGQIVWFKPQFCRQYQIPWYYNVKISHCKDLFRQSGYGLSKIFMCALCSEDYVVMGLDRGIAPFPHNFTDWRTEIGVEWHCAPWKI